MVYNGTSPLGSNLVDAYQRYIPQQRPIKIETVAIVGGSLALIATIAIVKSRKKKSKPKRKRK